ncbi:nucleotidyltransferase domain-containing protein [Cellulomonas dongxiuzhuiae]|uniref:Amino acid transporter n=1 Tax=Cellulomonas dongxiuzhuiae TaxID=2819979 RepID=A0ABX8GMC3_9CELL|nr:hypothetical protein [Cellulomonas dongxiuzhuiae]MBO3095889.1 hypothetical protein [Cellulomonas dongxiuzhuiae]QWC17190.1 hypothetical protein KKR89_06225 [Cellulomonas dongxiuzhuiae]
MGLEETRAWDPLDPTEVAALLADVGCRWWIAGGWALDLYLGRQTRPHADTDVVVLREDLPTVQRHLDGWTLMAADPPGTLRDWEPGEELPSAVHDVWCRPRGSEAWSLQLMVLDAVDDQWVYRRDPRVRRPIATITAPPSSAGVPVLAPEIQLLHKSHGPRPKDEQDLDAVAGHLSPERRAWLREALRLTDPGHAWLARL